jgi:hypothetical protein
MSSSLTEKQSLSVEFSGFFYNPRLLFAPCYYAPQALKNLEPFMTGKYSPRWFTAPFNPLNAIGPGLTIREQLRIIPGSVIAGWRFCTLGTGGGAAPDPSNIKFQVTDGNTQLSFTQGNSRFLNCASLIPSGATGIPFCLFPEPYEVGGGVITVALSNSSTTTAIPCQFLLYILEPVPTRFLPDSEGSNN